MKGVYDFLMIWFGFYVLSSNFCCSILFVDSESCSLGLYNPSDSGLGINITDNQYSSFLNALIISILIIYLNCVNSCIYMKNA